MDNIAILIPCYNEEKTIETVVKSFKQVLPEAVVYVYDNNSTDQTVSIAQQAGAIVRFESMQGKGNVIRRMFREIDAEIYVLVDGDDTYPAEQVTQMIDCVRKNGTDMVIGDRLSTSYFTENKRKFHNFGNKLVRDLITMFWNIKINDIMTGYRVFSRRFVKLFPVMSANFEIETEMTIHALDKRFKIEQIPIAYKDRPEGSVSKLNTFSDGMSVLKTIILLFKEYKPFHFFGVVAAILAIVAIVLFVPIFVEYLQIGLVPRFPTLFVAIFFALSALLSFFTGLILDVITIKSKKLYELKLIEYEQNK